MPRWAQIAFFLTMMMSVVAGLHFYFWTRLVRDTALAPPWSRVATWTLVALAVSLPSSFFFMRLLRQSAQGVVLWPVYLWMGLMFFLFVTLLTGDLVQLLYRGFTAIAARLAGPGALGDGAGAVDQQARREFLARAVAAGAALASGALGALAVRGAIGRVDVREQSVRLERLPRELDGFKLVQMTDIHVGPTIGRDFIEEIVAQANALEPDLVAITGDLVDGTVEQLRHAVEPLGRLKARHGVYFVTGNHEYYVETDAWMAELERLGIRVLRNERVSIGAGSACFDLAGVDDWSAGRIRADHGHDLGRACHGRDTSRELILLAHQPRAINDAARHGVGLQLSGHTHDGQIWPFKYLVALTQPYMQGLHRHGELTQIYVSRGTGYWGPPMRLGAPAEVTKLVLRCA